MWCKDKLEKHKGEPMYPTFPLKHILIIFALITAIGLFSMVNNTRIAINKISESNFDTKELTQELKSCREELQKINQKLDRF